MSDFNIVIYSSFLSHTKMYTYINEMIPQSLGSLISTVHSLVYVQTKMYNIIYNAIMNTLNLMYL